MVDHHKPTTETAQTKVVEQTKAVAQTTSICKDARYWEQPERAKYMKRYGCSFNCKTAVFAVSMLENRDKNDNHTWSCEQVESALAPLGVKLNDSNKWNAYYIANMLYSDYFDGAMFTDTRILKMAAYKLGDPDAKEGDIYTEWEAKMMNHCVRINYSDMI